MASFRWPKVEHDLALVQEYIEIRPVKPDKWDELAKRLSDAFQCDVKGRGCREHLDLLVKKHKSIERKRLKGKMFNLLTFYPMNNTEGLWI